MRVELFDPADVDAALKILGPNPDGVRSGEPDAAPRLAARRPRERAEEL